MYKVLASFWCKDIYSFKTTHKHGQGDFMRTVIFTIAMAVSHSQKICELQSGKTYKSIQAFIDTLIQYELIKDDSEVIVYEMWEYIQEYNTATVDDDSMNVAGTYMGYVNIEGSGE